VTDNPPPVGVTQPLTDVKAPRRVPAGFTRQVKLVTLCEEPTPYKLLDRPEACVGYWKEHIATASWFEAEKEHAVVLFLDTRKRVIGHNLVSIGLLDQSLVHAREVFRPAIVANAHSIVMMHNHPSGDPSPSEADIRTTRDLIKAGQLLHIQFVDHIVVGEKSERSMNGYCSLREIGCWA